MLYFKVCKIVTKTYKKLKTCFQRCRNDNSSTWLVSQF